MDYIAFAWSTLHPALFSRTASRRCFNTVLKLPKLSQRTARTHIQSFATDPHITQRPAFPHNMPLTWVQRDATWRTFNFLPSAEGSVPKTTLLPSLSRILTSSSLQP